MNYHELMERTYSPWMIDLQPLVGPAVVLILIAVATGATAARKGRSFEAWFVLGLMFSIIAFVWSFVLREQGRISDDRRTDFAIVSMLATCAAIVIAATIYVVRVLA